MISIQPVTPEFVAEIGDVDLARLTAAVFAEIEAAFNRYAVLVFRCQPINEEQQLAFAEYFGELEFSPQPFVQTPGDKRRIGVGMQDISNLDENGKLRRFVNVFVSDDDVRFLQGLDTPIPAGETLSIVPAVAGGC